MAIFFILQDVFTRSDLTKKDIIISIVSGLLGGVVCGFVFAWLMGLFAKSKFLMKGTQIHTEADESILFNTGATISKGLKPWVENYISPTNDSYLNLIG